METIFRHPRRVIGPIHKPALFRAAERDHARNRAVRRDTRPVLSAELQILADHGVPIESLMLALADAPADVSPLEAVFGSGLIGEETYYQTLAQRSRLRLLHRRPFVRGRFQCGQRTAVRSCPARGIARRTPSRHRSASGGRAGSDRDDVVGPTAAGELRPCFAAAVRRPRSRETPSGGPRERARTPTGSPFRQDRAHGPADRHPGADWVVVRRFGLCEPRRAVDGRVVGLVDPVSGLDHPAGASFGREPGREAAPHALRRRTADLHSPRRSLSGGGRRPSTR